MKKAMQVSLQYHYSEIEYIFPFSFFLNACNNSQLKKTEIFFIPDDCYSFFMYCSMFFVSSSSSVIRNNYFIRVAIVLVCDGFKAAVRYIPTIVYGNNN